MFIQFFNWTCALIYQNLFPFVSIVILLQIIILLLLRPDRRYNCHIKGCNEAFDTMEQLVTHLILEHDFSTEEITVIQQMKGDIK